MTTGINHIIAAIQKSLFIGAVFISSACASTIPQSLLDSDMNPVKAIKERKKELTQLNLTSDQKALIHLEIASSSSETGNISEHDLHMTQAMSLLENTKNNVLLCIASGFKATHYADFGKPGQAFAEAKKAISCSADVQDPLDRAYIRELAAWAILGGDYEQYSVAQPLMEEAMQTYKRLGIKSRELYTRFGLSRVYLSLRSSKEAYKESLSILEETKKLGTLPFFESYVAYHAGALALQEKDYENSIQLLDFAIYKSTEIQDQGGVNLGKYMLGRAYVAQGSWDVAIKLLRETLPFLKREGYSREYSMGAAALMRALAAKGSAEHETYWKQVDVSVANTPERLVKLFNYRAESLSSLGRHREAYEVQRDLIHQLETMHQYNTDNLLAKMASEYQLSKKENEISSLKLEKQVEDTAKQLAYNKQQYWISILVILVFVFIFVAWRQNKFKKEALHLALTDMGTGAPNRRAIMQKLDYVYNNAIPCLVGIADLDYFKKINDTFGHDVGDRVLSSFYLSCKNIFNNGEFVGRFGGEEWFFVLPGATEEDVKQLHKAITLELNHICSDLNMPQSITFSLGATYLDLTKPITMSIKEADKNLYNAKQSGRNKVVI